MPLRDAIVVLAVALFTFLVSIHAAKDIAGSYWWAVPFLIILTTAIFTFIAAYYSAIEVLAICLKKNTNNGDAELQAAKK